jgi:peptidoglycan/xylan/chitin deacetylase (PgdA/CDA1 family)
MQIASHGYRWTDYQYIPEAVEREHIRKTIEAQTRICGTRPVGFYQGKPNENTRRLLVEEGGFLYDADSYADDLPYWDCSYGKPHLVVPYSLDCNDMRFAQGLESDAFFRYLRDAFDVLYEEGLTQPKMMSVGLHCRIVGRPGRALGLIKFLDYIATKPHVWVAKRVDIAQHWHRHFHPDLVAQCPAPSPAPKCKL